MSRYWKTLMKLEGEIQGSKTVGEAPLMLLSAVCDTLLQTADNITLDVALRNATDVEGVVTKAFIFDTPADVEHV